MNKRIPELEEALQTSENLLQTIIESVPECVKLLAADGSVLLVNPAGLAMIQAESLEQVKGLSVCPLISPEYREQFRKMLVDVFQGKTVAMEFEMIGLKAGVSTWNRSQCPCVTGITR